jgi:glycosyltransferase involved in cell wall biosynthesis
MILNIIGKSNGVGLTRDIDVLSTALRKDGHEVRVTCIDGGEAHRRRSRWAQLRTRWRLRFGKPSRETALVDANLMLEHIWSQYLPQARCNVVMPNPEWFDAHDRRMLPLVDVVWAKTRNTSRVFGACHPHVVHIGFDSEDRLDAAIPRQPAFFHLAGKSSMKGTDRMLRVWARHPEWPTLTLIQHSREDHSAEIATGNIELHAGHIDDAELRRLQNSHEFHLCLSTSEGWGHYIVEALSIGAVTVTVDAPPMNELVTAERGMLVPSMTTGRQKLATTFFFDELQFERVIDSLLKSTPAQRQSLRDNSRRWYLENKHSFAQQLQTAVYALPLAGPRTQG